MQDTLEAYQVLRDHFRSSPYLPFIAVLFARYLEVEQFKDTAQSVKRSYQHMQASHRFLTQQEDVMNAFLLVLSERPASEWSTDVIDLYQSLLAAGKRYGRSYELPVLGSLALIVKDEPNGLQEIIATDNWLSEQKGLMCAGLLALKDELVATSASASSINGTLQLAIST